MMSFLISSIVSGEQFERSDTNNSFNRSFATSPELFFLKKLSKKDIKEQCPDISISTIEVVLHNLLQEEYIIKVGAGKNTSYIRNTEK